jgi:hypothetical protein
MFSILGLFQTLASDPTYAYKEIDEFYHFFKAFPERPKLKAILLENLVIN